MRPSFIIGVCGGSGSGKTTLANELLYEMQIDAIGLSLDAYYRSLECFPQAIRGNYDHPDAIDAGLFTQQLAELRAGRSIEAPQYDFATHTRRKETISMCPASVIVVDGVLLFAMTEALPLLNMKIFVDTPADIRLARRLRRDVIERGRDTNSVLNQYEETVRPMHSRFVEPMKAKADIVADGEQAFALVIGRILQRLAR